MDSIILCKFLLEPKILCPTMPKSSHNTSWAWKWAKPPMCLVEGDMGTVHILQYLSQNPCIWGIPVLLLGVSPNATDGEKKQIKDIVKQEQNRDRVSFYAKQKPPRTCMEVTKHSQSNTRKWRQVLKKNGREFMKCNKTRRGSKAESMFHPLKMLVSPHCLSVS